VKASFEVQKGDIRCQLENAFRRFYSMIKRATIILAAVTLSFGLGLAPKAFADDMKKDSMSKEDSMSKDSMKKDSMSKDTMSKNSVSKDGMKKDEMKK
jgi:pentapeptide MXKDX repeat protein